MATPGVDRLRNAIHNIQANNRSLLTDADNTLLFAKLVAEDLEKQHDVSSVSELQQATLDIITFSHKLNIRIKALDTLSTTYQPATEVTDFTKLLNDHTKELHAQSPFDPEKTSLFKHFKEAVWKVHHQGEPMPGQEQDDIITLSTQALANTVCPLSGKPVDQLDNPVRSQQCRHIYERDHVLNYIRQAQARRRNHRPIPCKCAAAGCPKDLVEEQLVCDQSLRVEIQEYILRQQSSNLDTVADCTYLEEDDETPLKSHVPH